MAGKTLPVGTFEAIVAADDIHAGDGRTVDVPEWGFSVRLRGLRRGEVRAVQDETRSAEEREADMLRFAFLEPVLTEDQARQIVTDKGAAATERILREIADLSGLLNATFQ